jgi:endonuclease/exonuclease/phosphatase (EEP) superfamily protein YafD
MAGSENKFLLTWSLGRLAAFFFIGATAFSLLAYLSPFAQSCELMSHFRVQYLVIQIVTLLLLVLFQRSRWLLLGVALLCLNGFPIAQYYLPQHRSETTQLAKFKLLQLNVLKKNNQYAKVVSLVQKEQPDIITFEEIDQTWLDQLKPLSEAYPYKQSVPQDNNFGIGLYSKFPLKNIKLEHFGKPYRGMVFPFISATVHAEKLPSFTVMAAHPLPPMGGFHTRNSQLADMAARRSTFGKNLIIAGDMNLSQWSSYFGDFTKISGLRDSQLGFGVQPTWPSTAFLMLTPIDHVLVSENFVVLDRRIGPDVGSDHLPVIVELGLRKDG